MTELYSVELSPLSAAWRYAAESESLISKVAVPCLPFVISYMIHAWNATTASQVSDIGVTIAIGLTVDAYASSH